MTSDIRKVVGKPEAFEPLHVAKLVISGVLREFEYGLDFRRVRFQQEGKKVFGPFRKQLGVVCLSSQGRCLLRDIVGI